MMSVLGTENSGSLGFALREGDHFFSQVIVWHWGLPAMLTWVGLWSL
jgi:hypothetical protein